MPLIVCPSCATQLNVRDEHAGRSVKCPKCSHVIPPAAPPPHSPAPPPPPMATATARPAARPARSDEEDDDRPRKRRSRRDDYEDDDDRPRRRGFECPYCGSTRLPRRVDKVSGAGWAVFVVLLLTTCFFCFIGLLIKDEYRVCSSCGMKLG